jgi:FKBP-type peptidyl-prolyl cis-trans isomerase
MWMLFCAVGLLAGIALAADDAKDPVKAEPKAADPAKDGPAKEVPKGPGVNDPVGPLKNLKEKVSYAIGLNIGRNMLRDNVDIDADLLATGIKAAMAEKGDKGEKPLLTEEQIREVIVAFQAEMENQATAKRKAIADKNKKDGEAFLTENGKKEGIKTTKSGMQYQVITDGTGPSPKSTDTVRTHYKGTLLDGTEFDSSYKRNVPATFEVDGVIEGWTEALQMMKVGSKWRLFLPAELAYKANGTRDGSIGPNAVLIFEVELLGIEAPDPLKKR